MFVGVDSLASPWKSVRNTLIPALLCVLPIGRHGPEDGDAHGPIANAIVAAGDYSVRHPWVVLSISAVLAIVAGIGASQITVDTNPLDSVEPTDPDRTWLRFTDAGWVVSQLRASSDAYASAGTSVLSFSLPLSARS